MLKKTNRLTAASEQTAPTQFLGKHPYFIAVSVFLMLFFGSLAAIVNLGGQTIGATDSRIVRLHIDGESQTVPTRAKTVKHLLERLNVNVNDKDIIEPALDTEITEDDFQVNVYKARPVMIVDDGKEMVAVSAEPLPRAVAKEAGLKVYPEDTIEEVPADLDDPTEVLRRGLVAEKVVIDRATPVSLNLYGKAVPIRTHAETVGELLAERNVKLDKGDSLQPAVDTPLRQDTRVFIVRHGSKIETTEEVIPMPVETINDPNLPVGTRNVREPGSPGKKIVTYEIKLRNGQEVSRRLLQEVIATPAVKEVVVVGGKGVGGANSGLLQALRMCESGGNYQINTGNGYSGAYQFSVGTWRGMGTGYAYSHQAPPAVQDDAALRLARRAGFHSQFPGCSRSLGLPQFPN